MVRLSPRSRSALTVRLRSALGRLSVAVIGYRLQIDTHRLSGLIPDQFLGRGSECATNGQLVGVRSSWVSVKTQMSALFAVSTSRNAASRGAWAYSTFQVPMRIGRTLDVATGNGDKR